jgi:hypothetical protein
MLDAGPYEAPAKPANLSTVNATVTARLPSGAARRRQLLRLVEVRRELESRGRGRAWINGREVGGADPRYEHLRRTHD